MIAYVFPPYPSTKVPTCSRVVLLLVQSSSFSFPPHSSVPTSTCLCTMRRRWSGTGSNECAKGNGCSWERCSRHVWVAHAAIGETVPLENITRLVRFTPLLFACTFHAVADVFLYTGHKDDKDVPNNWCCRPNALAYKDKRRTRKEWDAEWGKIGKEGNLWWVDASPDDPHSQHISGKRRQWEEVMGRSVWEWLLPIGDTKQKGLDYRPNPRFDAYGRWRKRREWPADLR